MYILLLLQQMVRVITTANNVVDRLTWIRQHVSARPAA